MSRFPGWCSISSPIPAPCCGRCAERCGRAARSRCTSGTTPAKCRDAAEALDPAARELAEGLRFPICRPDALEALVRDAGLASVTTIPIVVPTMFRDFEDYWMPFLGGQGPAPGYCMRLPEDRRAVLRERLRAALPADANGQIALSARAWAVRGTVPAP